ncbi:40S ribosomal S18-coprinopsis cinerea [Pyrrhoderma noxium]|uniref:40S ribosomal S18-coprinopsis cinerea n=1 Tax=Pyrrhoderma noxium TaxID=2282107 RepID=A0A286UX14_9AGAM|nr:40S ribosomal S18-coprinopsis cinerea [Pyrrhoderma noxium]
MSYADVTAHNAPPPSMQPKPDPALLNTEQPKSGIVADDTAKVNIVSPDFKRDPTTVTSEKHPIEDVSESDGEEDNTNGSQKRKRRVRRKLQEAEQEAVDVWTVAKEKLLQPGVAGGLVGVVNVGLLSFASYALYTDPELRKDNRVLSIGGISLLTLFGLEGYAAERYAQTPQGKEERKRAKEEGSKIYKHAREVVLRPGVLGGLVGLLNIGILGGVGYAAYVNWDSPRWDRRVVSAVSVGLLGITGAEGFLAEKYGESRKQ